MDIGDRIRELRRERGMTLRELAEKAKMSFGFLSDCEHNKTNPSIGTCQRIADALGVPASRLLGESVADAVQMQGNSVTVTWRCPEAGRLAELLMEFDDWRSSDKSELLAYLTAKETAREQKKSTRKNR